MRIGRNAKKGFTLVEVIVVLVILALLAAIMIPAMTGWIERAKEKRLLVACRACVLAAQTLAIEKYGAGGAAADVQVDAGDVKTLAGVRGDPSDIALIKAAVTELTYTEDADSVTYTRDPSPKYTFNGGSGGSGGGSGGSGGGYATLSSTDGPGAIGAIKNSADLKGKNSIDSGAALVNTGSLAAKAIAAMKDAGINLAESGATVWSYQVGSQGTMLYWTDCDVSTLQAGDVVPVMRYNQQNTPDDPSDDTYTVWNLALKASASDGKNFLAIDPKGTYTNNNLQSPSTASEQTYKQMLTDYKAARQTYDEAHAAQGGNG